MNPKNDQKRKYQQAVSDINITPLVDVLLVLLIIFMVTAPVIHHGVKVNTPDTEPSKTKTPPKDEEKATLYIGLNGKIKLRNQILEAQQLFQLIKSDKELQASQELYINADPNLTYGKVMSVIAIARKAGIRKLGVVVQPEELK